MAPTQIEKPAGYPERTAHGHHWRSLRHRRAHHHPCHPALVVHVGQNLVKTTSGRQAQITALTDTHAVVYWPDTNTQTMVKLERFDRPEWKLTP